MSDTYRVTAAYVTVKILDTPTGKPTMYGFYEGTLLPPSADPDNVAMLLRKGMVEKVAEPAVEPVTEPEPVKKAAEPEPTRPEPKPTKATAKAAGD